MECEYCKQVLKSSGVLKKHQNTAKYCLAKQNKSAPVEYTCSFCGTGFTLKSTLHSHLKICKANTPIVQDQLQILDEKSRELFLVKKDLEYALQTIEVQKKQIDSLQNRLQFLAEKAINRPTHINNIELAQATIDEIAIIKAWQTVVEIEQETETPEELIDEPYELVPLELDNGYIIESRDEDGYIDVTNLCTAGKKKFNHWNSLNKTTSFLNELSLTTGIPVVELIKKNTGGNGERHTWVHPQVAINIAQWISPQFDVKVSAWVLEVMMTGKVDITNTKSYRELQQDNKNKQLKIQLMTKKYVKKQPRTQFDEKNVVYILTTANMKKERRYILGKATNLTSRLSVYNKSDEHEVIYYQECPDEGRMSIVESLVFCKLNEYREQANRERFLLPEGISIDFFSNTIRECIAFIK